MKRFIHILTLVSLATSLLAQKNPDKWVRKGNEQYDAKKYQEAEVNYRKALVKDNAFAKGLFNLGDALYKQKNYDEAYKTFEVITKSNKNKSLNAEAYHNMGNTLMQSKKYEESIDAYKKALRLKPNDMDTKYNLAYAQTMLKKQQNDNKNNKDNKNDKNNQDKNKDKQDKDKKDQDKKDQNKDNQDKDDKQDQQNQQQKPPQISKEDAERMLEALKNNEKNTMDKLKKEKVGVAKTNIEKDW